MVTAGREQNVHNMIFATLREWSDCNCNERKSGRCPRHRVVTVSADGDDDGVGNRKGRRGEESSEDMREVAVLSKCNDNDLPLRLRHEFKG